MQVLYNLFFFQVVIYNIDHSPKSDVFLLLSYNHLYDIVKPKSYSPFLKCGIIKQVLWTFDITL